MRQNAPSRPVESLSGLIERVTFFNEDNGFAVLKVKAKGHRENVTLVGSLPSVSAREWITAEGHWVQDREFGLQFRADPLNATAPTTKQPRRESNIREVPYDFEELDEVSLAYATTIHKSQASEFPAVVIPLATQQYLLLQRNLVYTGVTRGKRLVVLVRAAEGLAIAVRNNKTEQRFSGLLAQLRS